MAETVAQSGNFTPAQDALDYYSSPSVIREPWLTADHKNMVGCMHPSCECRTNPRNKIQTSGGAYGVATDRQLAEIALNGTAIETTEAYALDATERHTSIVDAHYGCAFWKHRTSIVAEMARPSERTRDYVDYWTTDVYKKSEVFKRLTGDIMDAAGVQLEYLPLGEQEDDPNLIQFFDEINPNSKTIFEVEPISAPVGVYVVSHLANSVQNQRGRTKNTPNAYFDSLGAYVNLTGTHGDDHSAPVKELMIASAIVRAAAAREVINGMSPYLQNIEIRRHGASGVRFEQIDY